MDPKIISRRSKQIERGKNTPAYDNYIKIVPRTKRTKLEPSTPDKYAISSTQSFDQQITLWRTALLKYDSAAPSLAKTLNCSEPTAQNTRNANRNCNPGKNYILGLLDCTKINIAVENYNIQDFK